MSELSRKTQQIASAIYLITSFFDSQEPLRWRLRALAADLASESKRDKINIVKEIITLFGLAKSAGLISDVNHSILAQELRKFNSAFESPLSDMFLQEKNEMDRLPAAEEPVPQQKDKILETPKREIPRAEEKPALKDFGAVSVKKNSRQSIIIGALKRKKEVMIKDLVPLIEGCSEKTIQRELLTMVSQGILKKIGEKRWSRYTLA